jgi:homogentisate 1,2-dioxygenase
MAATKHYKNDYTYQAGFGNHFSSEALPDALPKGKCPNNEGPQKKRGWNGVIEEDGLTKRETNNMNGTRLIF